MVLMGGGAALSQVLQWSQGLLDGEGGHPSQKVEWASSLVIRACTCEEEGGGGGGVLLTQNW